MRGIIIRSATIFLTLLSLTTFGVWVAHFSNAQAKSPVTASEIIRLTNEQRLADGLLPLSVSPQLQLSAQKKAEDIVERNYWSHNTPEGEPFWVFVQDYDWRYLGENLAANFNTAEKAMTAWLNSPSHRANILNPLYQDIGVGISENIIVVLYGQQKTHLWESLLSHLLVPPILKLNVFWF
jgi:uncharacterized protein YkwD